ncbi:hypothetical protein HMI55_005261 [Coelomomyces lativittatus]|nr:hypothetical protein HMI55_005261 [Coelomomyces lativittatus]
MVSYSFTAPINVVPLDSSASSNTTTLSHELNRKKRYFELLPQLFSHDHTSEKNSGSSTSSTHSTAKKLAKIWLYYQLQNSMLF